MSKLIFIKTVPRETATRISDWVSDTSGVKMKKTKVGRANNKVMALYSAKVGGLANYISYNYHTDPITNQPVLNEKGQPMTLQEHLEKKWNKPAGYFSNQAASKHYRGDGSDLSYYYQKYWTLRDGTTVLDMSQMDDEIGYYVMLASSQVANSERELKEHKWPKAQWYISAENESNELKYTKNQILTKAYSLLGSSSFTDVLKRKAVAILEIVSSKGPLTTEQVFNLLHEYISSSNFLPNSNIEKLTNLTNLLKTKDGQEKFEAMWILKQAQDHGSIIYPKQDVWYWKKENGQTITIADRYADAVEFITNPKKSSEVEEILNQIKQRA